MMSIFKYVFLYLAISTINNGYSQQEFTDTLVIDSDSAFVYQEPKYPYFGPWIPPYIGIIGGVDGFRTSFLEFGITYNAVTTLMHPNTGAIVGGAITFKKQFANDITAFDAEIGYYSFVSMGINLNYSYTNLSSTFGIKPFIGTSIYHVQLLWGYNFFSKTSISELKHSTIKIRYSIPVFRIKDKWSKKPKKTDNS